MMKLSIGDLIFMGFGVAATLIMLLMGEGRRRDVDPAAERKSTEAYLRQISRHLSPILTIALIIGLSAVTYGLLAAYKTAK